MSMLKKQNERKKRKKMENKNTTNKIQLEI